MKAVERERERRKRERVNELGRDGGRGRVNDR